MTSNTKYNGRRNKRTAATLMHISPRIRSVLQILDVNSVHILQLYSQKHCGSTITKELQWWLLTTTFKRKFRMEINAGLASDTNNYGGKKY